MQTISLIIAMEQEAAPLIAHLGLARVTPTPAYENLPFRFYEGALGTHKITVTTPGRDPRFGVDNIGTEPASYMAITSPGPYEKVLVDRPGKAN